MRTCDLPAVPLCIVIQPHRRSGTAARPAVGSLTGSADPPLRAGPLTTPQASRHATDRIVAPPYRAFDAGLRPRPFPGETASLLPGLLTGSYPDRTSTGRRQRAYEHEDPPWHYVTVSPPALLGAGKTEVSLFAVPSGRNGSRRGARQAPRRPPPGRRSSRTGCRGTRPAFR
jgi:hypothetical protein